MEGITKTQLEALRKADRIHVTAVLKGLTAAEGTIAAVKDPDPDKPFTGGTVDWSVDALVRDYTGRNFESQDVRSSWTIMPYNGNTFIPLLREGDGLVFEHIRGNDSPVLTEHGITVNELELTIYRGKNVKARVLVAYQATTPDSLANNVRLTPHV